MIETTYTEEELYARIVKLITETPSLAGRVLEYAESLSYGGCQCCFVDHPTWTDEEISGWEEIIIAGRLLGYDL